METIKKVLKKTLSIMLTAAVLFSVVGLQTVAAYSGELGVSEGFNNPESTTVVPGQNDVEILELYMKAPETDISVTGMTFYLKGSQNLTNVSLRDSEGTILETKPVTGYSVTFDDAFKVLEGTYENIMLVGDVAPNASGEFYAYMKTPAFVQAENLWTDNAATVYGTFPITGERMYIQSSGELLISRASNSPAPTVLAAGSQEVLLSVFDLEAVNEDVMIDSLVLEVAELSGPVLDRVFVTLSSCPIDDDYYEEEVVACEAIDFIAYVYDNEVYFSGLDFVVAQDSNSSLYVHGDISDFAAPGNIFSVGVNEMDATGMTSGSSIVPQTLPVHGSKMTIANYVSTGTLSVFLGSDTPGGRTVSPGESGVDIMHVDLRAEMTEDLIVEDIVFDVPGIYSSYLFNKAYLVDLETGLTLSEIFWTDNGQLAFYDLEHYIEAGDTKTLALEVDMGSPLGGLFMGSLDVDSIYAYGVSSGSTADVDGNFPIYGSTFQLASSAVETGTLTVENDQDVTQVYKGQRDAVLMEMLFSASSEENIEVDALSIATYGTIDPRELASDLKMINAATGEVVAGPVEIQSVDYGDYIGYEVNFYDGFVLENGESMRVQLTGDIDYDGFGYGSRSQALAFRLSDTGINADGLSSGENVDVYMYGPLYSIVWIW